MEWIERDGTFWEVMNAQGQNWVSPRWIMIGEESMLWSAIFLDALENVALEPAYLSDARRSDRSRRARRLGRSDSHGHGYPPPSTRPRLRLAPPRPSKE